LNEQLQTTKIIILIKNGKENGEIVILILQFAIAALMTYFQ
jgi:hypothetical protein